MVALSPSIQNLVAAFQCLPGVGKKTAQRMVLYLVEHHRDAGRRLAKALLHAMENVKYCEQCRGLSEEAICGICGHMGRDRQLLCVVETPLDVLAIEQTGSYHGLYFVLRGRLSPLNGLGPEKMGIVTLQQRLQTECITEVILATNPTVEGEATAYYLSKLVKEHKIKVTRIAYGVPFGGELEYLDGSTLVRALSARTLV